MCQIGLLCVGTLVIKKLTAVLLNVTDDVSSSRSTVISVKLSLADYRFALDFLHMNLTNIIVRIFLLCASQMSVYKLLSFFRVISNCILSTEFTC